MRSLVLANLVVLALGGCDLPGVGDGDPVHGTVTLAISVQSSDTDGDGTVADDQPIDASGDSWSNFVESARAKFGGDPTSLVLAEAHIALLPSSSGVASLGNVFHGPIGVRFETNGTRVELNVAEADIRPDNGATGIQMFKTFDDALMDEVDAEQLYGGAFRVHFIGQTSMEFKQGNARADLQATLSFEAEHQAPTQ